MTLKTKIWNTILENEIQMHRWASHYHVRDIWEIHDSLSFDSLDNEINLSFLVGKQKKIIGSPSWMKK